MTVDSSMSSGYCSLEEELEDCFFTAKTTFFRNVQSKRPSKVNVMTQEAFTGRKQALWSRRETGSWQTGCQRLTGAGGQLPCGPS